MFFIDPELQDRVRMAAQEQALRMTRFIDEMSADDAFTFYQMIHAIASSNNPTEIANHLSGQLHMLLRRIHNVCPSCGERHEPIDHEEWEMTEAKKENEVVKETQENTTEIPGSTSTPPEDTD